jgi:hypothetical protein
MPPGKNTPSRLLLQFFAASALCAYVGWWIYWLVQGRLPSAPLKALTGLPAPSTGCTRSLRCFLQGQPWEALRWNAFSVPLTAMLALSVGWLAVCLLLRRKLLLPSCFLHIWSALLVLAWASKFCIGPSYW